MCAATAESGSEKENSELTLAEREAKEREKRRQFRLLRRYAARNRVFDR